jgi:cytochrome c oxidase cbb3-type subunit III
MMRDDGPHGARRDRKGHGEAIARFSLITALVAFPAVVVAAQPPSPRQDQPDAAAIDRGRELLATQCGFCHGTNARGGSSGPDLTRSALVQEDEGGKQLGEFLRVGRPDRGMPKFDQLGDAQMSDLAAFLHDTIRLVARRNLYKILDILVGDAKAGEAMFNGAGRCATCHSLTGDFKGIGAKYTPEALQGRIVRPRGRTGPPAGPPRPPYTESTAVKATVTPPSGPSFTGAIIRLTDFDVILYDQSTGQMRSWLRNGDVPRVVVSDPLQAHIDMLSKWTDADMHNMTAYLASLK